MFDVCFYREHQIEDEVVEDEEEVDTTEARGMKITGANEVKA